MSEISKIEGKVLGKQVSYPQSYSPDILVAVPRHFNRSQYQIDENNLPFIGYDAWHAYEFSFLTKKGLPVARVLKLVYPANSPCIVESKSLKLYLNSFNMSRFGNTPTEGLAEVEKIITNDLSKLLSCEIKTGFIVKSDEQNFDFSNYSLLEELPEVNEMLFDQFSEAPELLHSSDSGLLELKVCSHLLRSNCKITSQPDWGSVFIHLKTTSPIHQESLLKYLISFRNENHFHEEVCEMIYKRLLDQFNPELITVTCIYTRRGGIDICPSRSNRDELLPKFLLNENCLSQKLLRQ